MCTNCDLPKLKVAEIETLKVKPYPKPKRDADEDIYQNNDHIRKEGNRIRLVAASFGVPTNEHGLVAEAVLEVLIKNSTEE